PGDTATAAPDGRHAPEGGRGGRCGWTGVAGPSWCFGTGLREGAQAVQRAAARVLPTAEGHIGGRETGRAGYADGFRSRKKRLLPHTPGRLQRAPQAAA